MTSQPSSITPPPGQARLSEDLRLAADRQAKRVSNCLAWDRMSRIPTHYELFAAAHFRLLAATGASPSWTDACPAYALAYLTSTAYGPATDPADAWELELQWDELAGASGLAWRDAEEIVRQGWAYLASTGEALSRNALD